GRGVQVYDLTFGRKLAEFEPGDVACGLAFVRGGEQLAVVTLAGELKFYDPATGAERSRLGGRLALAAGTLAQLTRGQGVGVAVSPDGRYVAQGAADGRVKVWDAATGGVLLDEQGHLTSTGQVAFSPDSRRLASGGDDALVRVWDLERRAPLLRLKGH